MEGCVQNLLWELPTTSHVFQNDQFPANISNVHEYDFGSSSRQTSLLDYMDDILIASKGATTINDHRAAVRDVLQVLQDYDLFLKPEKCVWESPCMDYLGLILEKGVTRMDPAKVTGVKDWPTPTTVKQVRSFLGFCNFYRAFIRGFSHLAKPLNNLTKKDTLWTWGTDQQITFGTL